jgi:hypothetical protein
VAGGALELEGAIGQLAGTTLTAGQWSVSGGTLGFGGRSVATNAAVIQIQTATVAAFPAISGLSFNSGELRLRAGADVSITPAGGKLTNNGTISLSSGAALDIAGGYTQGAAGILGVTISGTDPDEFGALSVSGQAALNGEVRLTFASSGTIGGLEAGDQITFLTCGSRIGAFATETIGAVPGGLTATLAYLSTGVRVDIA